MGLDTPTHQSILNLAIDSMNISAASDLGCVISEVGFERLQGPVA